MKYLPDVFKFMELLAQFQNVERRVDLKGRNHPENDAEHSYQLAMLAWYFVTRFKLNLDINKVLKYAMAHDLVEVYAGDTFAYAPAEHTATKKTREREAQQRLAAEFSDFVELHDLISGYEERKDEEARFVYALDKIIPIINMYFADGRTWHAHGITLPMLLAIKEGKVDLNADVRACFDELVELLKANEEKLFPKK